METHSKGSTAYPSHLGNHFWFGITFEHIYLNVNLIQEFALPKKKERKKNKFMLPAFSMLTTSAWLPAAHSKVVAIKDLILFSLFPQLFHDVGILHTLAYTSSSMKTFK